MSSAVPVPPGASHRSHPDLYGRSFLKELDFDVAEWRGLLRLAARLKIERRTGRELRQLQGRNFALVFEKASTRTRCAFEVAAHDQGAHLTYLDPAGSQLGRKESLRDTARVLGRMYDAIAYRGFDQASVEQLSQAAGVPVWNGLSDQWHPTQSLCDMLTMTEHAHKAASEITFAYLGDARNNVANSLLVAGAMMGMDVRMVAPESLWNPTSVISAALTVAAETKARLHPTADVARGVRGADFVYTDVWVSMGEAPEHWQERVSLLSDYAVTTKVMAASGNPAVRFMHCLPALHNLDTVLGRQLFERTGRSFLEVEDEVFESPASIVFDQAENRLHTIKAVLVATLGHT
ncbi:ornithine carbamoyltransferase [Microlunatus panaciterrae]|uniref:Ornithine carbamoyltransferase n=2 Tax=Microlunatus panaciterrae TaxID=400768 RepID=A0ABS2RFC6_9ACTN|nr:ornithine carbamoyltransferase [Microlunatus panaciterrae]MBM7797696.1 ornithine carbamoyltransferase [Microlunatus panaciterrae]